MSPILIDVLYGVTAALAGATGGAALTWFYFQRKAGSHAKVADAAEALRQLQELAARVAIDVGEHSSRVEEINDSLIEAKGQEPTRIVDVVARLIEANQQMQEKLSSTEDKLRQQAQQLQTSSAEARTDALTMLANRRALDTELARRVAHYAQHGQGFAMIMADVDHFKKFNDAYGHQAGDDVLRGVARILRRSMREVDLVARFGGEEFAVILPATGLDEGCKAAQRACEAIQKARFRHDGTDLRVTISLGVAELLSAESGTRLVERADAALYAAKANGRNCVYGHEGSHVVRVVPVQEMPPAAPASNVARPAQSRAIEATGTAPHFPPLAELSAASGLPNRTAFCQQVRNRTAEAKRGGPTFSVILVEVDQYDRCPEPGAGPTRDAAMATAARLLHATVREMDIVAYYAPGCYALLLPTAPLIEAARIAERLRKGGWQEGGLPAPQKPSITLSIGLAQIMDQDDSVALLERAETALDTAIYRGGNQSCYHDGLQSAPVSTLPELMAR